MDLKSRPNDFPGDPIGLIPDNCLHHFLAFLRALRVLRGEIVLFLEFLPAFSVVRLFLT